MIIDLRRELRKYGIRPKYVLKVGAHEGQGDEMYRRMNTTPIYVEANPEVFARLRSNLPDRECHHVAISDHQGTAEFHVMSADQSSSLLSLKKHAEIYPDIVETKTVQVACTTIDKLLALRGATKLLQSVSCVLTEVNRDELYEGCAEMQEIDDYLAKFDLVRVSESFFYHESWGDALYLKSDLVKQSSWWNRLGRFVRGPHSGRRAA